MDYDVLVVGSGIGGMKSALKLGDMGFKVLVVEREASVGGKMILLSKVFPTLDCASCISTPKMAATIHHPNITTYTYSEVDGIQPDGDGRFRARITRKARFVDKAACTGCQKCEMACTVAVPDQFNADLVARRAAYIAFPQAVPKKAVIDRAGSSPCSYACPAGIQAHGYISLIPSGESAKAYQLVLEATPLVGTLGRACYARARPTARAAPSRGRSRSASSSGSPPIATPRRPRAPASRSPTRTAAGWRLTASARRASPPPGSSLGSGMPLKIFEAAPEPGGFLRMAIPSYRLPIEVVERDIENVRAIGVEIATNSPVRDVAALKEAGFDAVLLATGTPRSTGIGVPGEDRLGVFGGTDFLRKVKLGQPMDVAGKRVVVIGGGNVAMDTARTARRLGAASVTVAYRRGRQEMPAHHVEADDAEREGVAFSFQVAPAEVLGDEQGAVSGLRCTRMTLGAPDASGRRRPEAVPGSEFVIPCEIVVGAIGMTADTGAFASHVSTNANGTLRADATSRQTALPYVFAAGDVVNGATDITRAVGEGRRAAHMIDRWLTGGAFDGFDDRLPVVDKELVLARQKAYTLRASLPNGTTLVANPVDFAEVEAPLTEAEARGAAGRCLDCARLQRVRGVRRRLPGRRVHRPPRA